MRLQWANIALMLSLLMQGVLTVLMYVCLPVVMLFSVLVVSREYYSKNRIPCLRQKLKE